MLNLSNISQWKKEKKGTCVYIARIISIKEGARMAQEPAKALNNRVIEC